MYSHMLFLHMYVGETKNYVDILHSENRKEFRQKWKIKQFSKGFKIVNSAPNHILNSEKNSYRVFDPESKD